MKPSSFQQSIKKWSNFHARNSGVKIKAKRRKWNTKGNKQMDQLHLKIMRNQMSARNWEPGTGDPLAPKPGSAKGPIYPLWARRRPRLVFLSLTLFCSHPFSLTLFCTHPITCLSSWRFLEEICMCLYDTVVWYWGKWPPRFMVAAHS